MVASFKPNGGVISATNHGFQLSHGSVVIFVDADDYLLPGAVPAHAHALRDTAVVRSQAYMTVPHRNGFPTRIPGMRSAEGDLRDLVLRKGAGGVCLLSELGQCLVPCLSGTRLPSARKIYGTGPRHHAHGRGSALRENCGPRYGRSRLPTAWNELHRTIC